MTTANTQSTTKSSSEPRTNLMPDARLASSQLVKKGLKQCSFVETMGQLLDLHHRRLRVIPLYSLSY